jgi:hypothetical protein
MTLKKASKPEHAVSKGCRAAFDAFAGGDLRHWQGLPSGCQLAAIADGDTLQHQGQGTGLLGQGRASYRMIAVEHYTEPVRVWHVDGNILLMDVRFPVISPDLRDLLESLGKPEALLDSHFSSIVIENSEWVYASKGLSLYINPDNFLLLRLAVYHRSSVEDYHQKLRLQLEIRRRPGFI